MSPRTELGKKMQARMEEALMIAEQIDEMRIENFTDDQRVDIYLFYREKYPECSLQLLYDLIILGLDRHRTIAAFTDSITALLLKSRQLGFPSRFKPYWG